MATKKQINTLVVVSDTHCGCALGLCPPTPIPLDDGGTYKSSAFQQKVWGLWREFWDVWIPEVTRGEPFDLVHNGDAIDGVHHGGTTQITHNIGSQVLIGEIVMAPEVAKCKASGGTYYHIRGTEAHVGKSGVHEEQLARQLGAKPNREGQYARYDLWKRIGGANGPLIHLLHHIGTTGSAAHEASAVNAELTAEYVEAARWGRQPPDYIVRSHRHRSIAVDIDSGNGPAAAIVTPAWQGRTPFAWKIPGARLQEPQFGGIVIRKGEETTYYRRWVKTLDRSPED